MALHQNSNENNKHTPKGFTSAPNMGKILRDENGLSTYVPETTLPASLNFVNGAVAPPTEVLNQVYVLVDTGGGTIHPNWDGLVYNNWCRFNGASWIGYTPVNGDICYDSTALKYKIFQTTAWVDFGVSGGGGGGDNLSTTDLVQADEDRNYTIPNLKSLISEVLVVKYVYKMRLILKCSMVTAQQLVMFDIVRLLVLTLVIWISITLELI